MAINTQSIDSRQANNTSCKFYTMGIANNLCQMTDWRTRARARMKQIPLTQEAIGEQLGITQGAVGHWLSGRREPETLAQFEALAKLLQFRSLDILLYGENGVSEAPATYKNGPPPIKEISIVGNTQGGPDVEHLELGYPPGYGDQYFDMATGDPNAYGLIVKGNSMAPRIREGDAIWIEPNHHPEPGDTVVAKFIGGEVMVKDFISRRNGKITLDSIAKDEERIVRLESDIEYMHYVGGVVFPGKIKQRV